MVERLLILIAALVCCAVYIVSVRRGTNQLPSLILSLFVIYAVGWIAFMAFLWLNHINFPLNLEAMELTVLQHLKRLMAGQPLYVEPSPDFTPLAYAPLYYYLSVPFAWLFGTSLFTMRLVAILGMLGSMVLIFLAVKKQTASFWWSLIAVGLFAAAYRAMDTYLDNAHSDSWLLCSILIGCYLININRSRATNLLGIFFLVLSFWFKQHGAIFAIGGVLFLTWRDGLRNSWMYWLLAAVMGPGLYTLAPKLMVGSQFHYYTLTVPSHWSEFTLGTVKRYAGYVIKNYFLVAGVGIAGALYLLIRQFRNNSIWFFMLPFAMLSGFMGALDPGSNNNVFITMGVWFILTGVLGLHAFWKQFRTVHKWALHLFIVGASFALLYFPPQSAIVSSRAPEAYQDLVRYLNALDGPVYAPWLGQLESGYTFSPAVHWVPMEDLIRGPGVDEYNHPNTRKLLNAVIHPTGSAYILMNYPLENDTLLSFLLDDYQLEEDLGERFAPLSTLPRRFNPQYPRYLYKYAPPTR